MRGEFTRDGCVAEDLAFLGETNVLDGLSSCSELVRLDLFELHGSMVINLGGARQCRPMCVIRLFRGGNQKKVDYLYALIGTSIERSVTYAMSRL